MNKDKIRKVYSVPAVGINTPKTVSDFHYIMGFKDLKSPGFPDEEICKLRLRLLREEVDELEEAINESNLTKVIDALCDIQYILGGSVCAFGMKNLFDTAFAEVHNSNMMKTCVEEEDAQITVENYKEKGVEAYYVNVNGYFVVKRKSDNKVLKPYFWKSPEPKLKMLLKQNILSNKKQSG